MNRWPQKASCPEEKVDTFAFSRCYCRYQDLLEIPGSEVSENCLVSFVADNPRIWLRLSIQFWFVGGNHSRALRRKWQEGMQLGFWGECIMVYRPISVKLWDSRPVLIGLSDLPWDSCSGDLKWVILWGEEFKHRWAVASHCGYNCAVQCQLHHFPNFICRFGTAINAVVERSPEASQRTGLPHQKCSRLCNYRSQSKNDSGRYENMKLIWPSHIPKEQFRQ